MPAPSAKHPANGASYDLALMVVEGYCTLIAYLPSTRARTLAKARAPADKADRANASHGGEDVGEHLALVEPLLPLEVSKGGDIG